MKKRRIITIITIFIMCLLTIILDWYQWDVIAILTVKYNSMISGIFYYFICFIKLFIFIVLIIWDIKLIKKNQKKIQLVSFLPTIFIILTLLCQTYLPLTDTYAKLDYNINYNKREKIISMFNGKESIYLEQVKEDTYLLPYSLRMASHNAKIIIERGENKFKLLFYVHRGIFKNSAIIYVSDGSEVKNGDFNLKYNKVELISDHWYLVKH